MRILVTDGDSRAALALTRSLGCGGHEVHVTAPRARSLAGASRYCAGRARQAAIADGPRALGRSLLRAARDIGPDLVLGVTDATLTVLHELADELQPARMVPPGAAAYARASDKVDLFRTSRAIGIPVPDGLVVAGGQGPDAAETAALGSPLVVRPALSWRVCAGEWVRGGVGYEPSAAAVAERVGRDPALRFPYLVQRHVEGEGCGLFVLALRGRLLRMFAHRRLREKPPSGGVSTLCVSVSPPEDLAFAASRWVAQLSWSGIAMLEFRREARSGIAYLLEVNARPWGSLALAAASGLDFACDLVDIEHVASRDPHPAYRQGVRLRWLWGEVDHFYLLEKERGYAGLHAAGRGFVRAALAGPWPDAWDTFRRDDPVPFAVETWDRACA